MRSRRNLRRKQSHKKVMGKKLVVPGQIPLIFSLRIVLSGNYQQLRLAAAIPTALLFTRITSGIHVPEYMLCFVF